MPQVVGSLPLQLSGDDGYAAKGGRNLVANGGSLDLFETHVHDPDYASGERGGDDEPQVSEVYGFVIDEVVGGFVVVGDGAPVDFV